MNNTENPMFTVWSDIKRHPSGDVPPSYTKAWNDWETKMDESRCIKDARRQRSQEWQAAKADQKIKGLIDLDRRGFSSQNERVREFYGG